MAEKTRRTDALFEPGLTIKHPGGRPKVHLEPRVRLHLWVRQAQLAELEQLKAQDRTRLAKAGKKYTEVTITSLVEQALADFIKRRRRT